MSDQTRRGLTLSWLVLFVLSILLQYGTLTNPRQVDAAHDVGIFELDGDADDSVTAGADWENGAEGALDEFFVGAASEASANDNTYFTTGGSKDENDIPSWEITENAVPDKNELLDAYAAAYASGGDLWVFFGADRFDNDGDAQIGFWFFQNTIGIAAGDFTGVHADGDVLILSEYTNGGVVDLVCAYEWDGSGGGANIADAGDCDPATDGSNLNLVAAGAACDVADGTFDICAVTNAAVENAPWPFTNKDGSNDFGVGQFFEGGINLSDLFGGDPPCFSSFLAETRSSQETDAQLKDFALGSFDTCGSLTIVKDAVPDDAQDFGYTTTGGLSPSTFNLDDDGNATLSNTRVYTSLETGQYTVSENAVANWQLTNLVCNDANGSVDLGTRTATVNLGPGEHVTCTFTNTRYGRIIVDKVTNPGGSSQSFEFDPSYGANFFLTDAATPNDSGFLAPGTYSVAEVNIPAGWDLTGATCSDGSPVNAINLALNETVTCTFTNRQDGQIIVDKVTDPSGSSQQFEFDPSYGANFFLTDAATPNNSGNLDPGTYSVVELVPDGWDLSSVSCSDGSANTSINLGAGETVTCTFNNRQDGQIVVIKQTTPDGSAQSFEFDPSWGANFFLTDGQSNNSGNLDPGTYSVAEVNIPAGWDLTGATCSDGSAVNSISLQAGEVVTCTFNDRQDGKIITVKQTTPDGSAQSFEFDPSWGGNFNLNDGQSNDSGFLDPGTYSVAEVNIPAGWDLTGATCDDGSNPASISLAAGEIVTCTFDNRQDGRIIVVKQTLPDGASQSFEFDPSYAANFFLTDGQQNTSAFLDPGEYSVAEVNIPAGWDLTSATCDMGETVDDIDLGAGETVTCTFTNTQRGHIVVDKVTNPSGDPQSFSFDAGGSGYSDFSLTDAAAPNNQEVVPGSYSVSETVPSGWDLTSATCDQGETPASLDVGPGETVTCTFVNTKRGTIIVEKQTSPTGGEGFVFTGDAAGTLDDDEQIVVTNLVPGTYTSTEADPTPDYDLTSILCDDAGSSGNLETRTATFDLDPGEEITCVFTNTQRGTITIIKDAQPNDAQNFGFDVNGFDGPIFFELDDDGNATLSNMQTFENVPPGAYSVTEQSVEGWDLIDIECVTLGGASAEIDGATADLTMAPGGSITCTYINAKPSISIVKTAGDAADGEVLVQGPGNVTYSYVVENTGPVALVDIEVWDDNGTPGDTGDDFQADCPATTLAAGASMTCTFTVMVTENRVNEAEASGQSDQGTPVSDTDDAEVRVPGISIVKSHDDTDGIVGQGQTVTFTLVVGVTNGPVTNAVVTDVLPDGQTYVDASQSSNPAATFAIGPDGELTWTFASLPSGAAAATISYDVTIDADALGALTNVAEVCVDEPGVPCDDDDTTVEVPALVIDKSFTGNTGGTAVNGIQIAKIEDTLTYTLAYDLTGGPVHDGVITDTIPTGLTYVAGTATNNDEFTFVDYDAATRTLTWTAPLVSKDGSVTYQVTVDDDAFELAQPLVNVATIDSDETPEDDDEDDVLIQEVLEETSPPTLPPTDSLGDGGRAPSSPGFGLMLALLVIAGIGLAASYLVPAPARARRGEGRHR
ncbi:MAG TPA: hypothetical protein VFX65_05020 [Candidatus Limnocylindrales bacterium]|nr:hypothetical protein [Candidatus Limnocylindrales bacterium]